MMVGEHPARKGTGMQFKRGGMLFLQERQETKAERKMDQKPCGGHAGVGKEAAYGQQEAGMGLLCD